MGLLSPPKVVGYNVQPPYKRVRRLLLAQQRRPRALSPRGGIPLCLRVQPPAFPLMPEPEVSDNMFYAQLPVLTVLTVLTDASV